MRVLSTIQRRENLNRVFAMDEKGNGNANYKYLVVSDTGLIQPVETNLYFQNGARKDKNSTHGVLDTDLLEIVRDRLIGFQDGEYSSRYNALALTHIEEALMWMNRRVEDRIERNVLGTYNK